MGHPEAFSHGYSCDAGGGSDQGSPEGQVTGLSRGRGPDPPFAEHCTQFPLIKSPMCYDPVSQAGWAFTESAGVAGGETEEGPKELLAREACSALWTHRIPPRLALRLLFVGTKRTLKASAK